MTGGSFQQFISTTDTEAGVIQLPDKFLPQPGKKLTNSNYTVYSTSTVEVY